MFSAVLVWLELLGNAGKPVMTSTPLVGAGCNESLFQYLPETILRIFVVWSWIQL